jgi:hypothetical protein
MLIDVAIKDFLGWCDGNFWGQLFQQAMKLLFPLLALFIAISSSTCSCITAAILCMAAVLDLYYFLLMVIVGRLVIRKVTVKNVIMALYFSTLLLWLLSDLKVWLGGGTKPANIKTINPR